MKRHQGLRPVPREDAPIELVVARYQEDLRWTRRVPREVRVTLYDKGGSEDWSGMPWLARSSLENVGRESHSYLHHVVTHYHELAPITVFVQGFPFDHAHDLHKVLRSLAEGSDRVEGFRWLGFIIDSDDPRGRRLHVPWSKNPEGRELDLGSFYRILFRQEAPPWTHFFPGGQFAVSREQILSRPLRDYQRALEMAVHFPDAAYCFERTWDRVFGARGVDPDWLGGELTRYLKPIRRLQEDERDLEASG